MQPHSRSSSPRPDLVRRYIGSGVRRLDAAASRVGVATPPIRSVIADHSLGGLLHARSPLQRPDGRRLALTFDLDYQRDTDVLVDLIALVDAAGAKMSVCSIAALVERDPDPYQAAVASGHEIVNHSWTHPDNPVLDADREFWDLDADGIAEQISEANARFDEHLGLRTSGFRTPHFKDTARMIPVLESDPDTHYISSVLATSTMTGLPYVPAEPHQAGRISHTVERETVAGNDPVVQLPLTACPEHRWSPFCSYHHLRAPSDHSKGAGMHDAETLERHWNDLLTRHRDDGYLSFYFDPHDIMRDDDTSTTFARCLRATSEAGWEIVTLAEMADAWRPVVSANR